MTSLAPFFTAAFVPLSSPSLDEPSVQHRQPSYALEENERHAYLEIELPGVAKENVNLDIAGNKLAVSAKRFRASQTGHAKPVEKAEDAKTNANDAEELKPYVVYELKIRIGHRYDTQNIEASMDGNGILKMVIPLRKKETPRKISIQ